MERFIKDNNVLNFMSERQYFNARLREGQIDIYELYSRDEECFGAVIYDVPREGWLFETDDDVQICALCLESIADFMKGLKEPDYSKIFDKR